MKFSINCSSLQNAVSIVAKGVSNRSMIPVLSGIMIEAKGDELRLQATDLEASIQYTVQAMVEEEGQCVLPGKTLNDVLKNLSSHQSLHVDASPEQALITCDTFSCTIKSLNPEDFPAFPSVNTDQQISIPFSEFCSMVKKVARCVSRDESHIILTGVLITAENSTLKMVATDSYRLAVTERSLDEEIAEPFQAVIPGTFLQEIASLPKTEADITLALAENQIVATVNEIVFINRRIEGNYPNYKQLIPESYTTRAKLEVDKLESGVKRVAVLGNTTSAARFDLNNASQTLLVSTSAQDTGSSQETIPCEVEGEDVEIAFNYTYVLEGLASITTDNVYLEIQSSMKPGLFRAEEPENFLYVVMPVRM